MRRFRHLLIAAVLLGAAVPVLAQGTATVTAAAEPHALGHYAGVTPGGAGTAPRQGAIQGARGTLLTWPGFQARPDGASRFFLQTSGPVQHTTNQQPNRFEVILPNTSLHVRNNSRPLETRFFNTPVARARVERRGRDLAVVFEMRAEATPRVYAEAAGGLSYLYVEFPAGNYLPAETAETPAQ